MFVLRETQSEVMPQSPSRDNFGGQSRPLSKRQIGSDAFCATGLSSNTSIHSARGWIPARELRAGDLIHTYDNGLQPLLWVGFSRAETREGNLIRALKSNGCRSQMMLAANHLVLQTSEKSDLLFGAREVLCPAKTLIGSQQFETDDTATPTLVHLLFDQFQLLQAGDVWVESHVPDMARTQLVAPEVFAEIVAASPRLAHENALANYVQHRLVLEEREVACLMG